MTAPLPPVLVSPIGGAHADTTTVTFTWQTIGPVGDPVRLGILKAGVLLISGDVPNTGSFSYGIPGNAPIGNDYKLRAQSIPYPSILDLSDEYFGVH